MKTAFLIPLIAFALSAGQPAGAAPRKFVHPGIDMNSADLEYMKRKVREGAEPWATAYTNLKNSIPAPSVDMTGPDLDLPGREPHKKSAPHAAGYTEIKGSAPENEAIKAVSHVIGGAYNNPDIGASAILEAADAAYDCALLWYVSEEKAYAERSRAIIADWAANLRSLDDNNAKLLVALTGYQFCNAAEILRYSYPGWRERDTDDFTRMLMQVYYPMLRLYFSDANGNWDGAIMHSLLAIAVFTDNHAIFDDAVEHFMHAPQNGSLFKYVYPSGQCQETPRDQAHVQMGLAEFGGTARIAYTQGVDLFSLGGNRLALGFEYTAKFLLGEPSFVYGIQSPRRTDELREDFEYFYRHYRAKGVATPYLARMSEKVRPQAGRGVLTGFRAEFGKPHEGPVQEPRMSRTAYPAGALESVSNAAAFGQPVWVEPGASIQEALDRTAGTGNPVILKAGIHTITEALRIPSNITLAGEGARSVVMCFQSKSRFALVNASDTMRNVILADFVLEGARDHNEDPDPNGGRFNRGMRYANSRDGIRFLAPAGSGMQNISLINLSVINFSKNGVYISGAGNVTITGCNISDNGSGVVPGPKLHHNLHLGWIRGCRITHCRLDTSLHGCGLEMLACDDAEVRDCEIARNAWYGVHLSDCRDIRLEGCLIEANDDCGIGAERLHDGCGRLTVTDNDIQFNAGYGILLQSDTRDRVGGNRCEHNGRKSRITGPTVFRQ